jgi:hypothetical protein
LNNQTEDEASNAMWGDDETRKFYEALAPLRDQLPAALVGVGSGLCAVTDDDDDPTAVDDDDDDDVDDGAVEALVDDDDDDDDEAAAVRALPSTRSVDGDGLPLPLSGASHNEQVCLDANSSLSLSLNVWPRY